MEGLKPLMIRSKARWDLDLTTENGQYLAVLDFLSAATLSDVQPLSLAFCEAFGSVLAICSRTLTVTETRLFRELPQPASVGFLPALSVGFSDGTAEALASTLKGLRFLCLAAALVTSVGPFDGAKAIITMMHDSKLHEEQTIWIPRTQQLADILKSLEAKSAFCGFAELMVQWEIHLRQEVFPRAFDPMAETGDASAQERLDRARRLMLKGLPPPETIARIVDAFRTVTGVKYRAIAEVEIKLGAGAAWVLAFAEWCFGTAPALCLLHARVDGGHTYEHISGSPASLVKVTIPASSSNKFTEILVRYRSRGQVVYPSAYESDRIERVGYLRLSHFYGVLRYDRDVYNVVASPDNEASDVSDDQKRYIYENNQNPEILQPTNLYRNVKVSWEVVTQDYGEIQANFLVHIQDRNFTARRNPSLLITALKDTFFYEDCLHDRQSMLEEADRFITNQPPWHEVVAENDENPRVNIIAVDNSEELRRFALAHANGPVVLRRDACLRCCLDLCRRTSARRLIL
ncbi:hypothetical protein M431DRAFT_18223 [Trichoderma harzianum CBS 226.95]|uniref:Uncharacterized protein n=1 Tax=Trichoderma harzianum CBS 226.95 TaxID=983964 RepID=A0A2T4A6Q1_TRIHA|nr:hypothetical protein M431DRAFT_18223 [Trichoderma harzianum CBS 226.95]PTB52706.1 hypothetical protein M431DRAFT_18223 [Trichoderma harzianum CBS 226.95]